MRKVTANTMAHLVSAMDAQRAVTIRYMKANGEVSRRAIEIHAVRVSAKGDVTIECFDRRSATRHTFRLDRITGYTLHRAGKLAAYRAPVVADTTEILDADTDEICGFRAWDFAYQLAA
jgi:predicted DNA-binding transcriptional regulator YafY